MDSQSRDSVVLRMKILFIDDDRMLLGVVGEMLSGIGYQVEMISDPYEAILYSQNKLFDIDLIIVDIHMPKMSGITVVRKIREMHPDEAAIFLTGNVDIAVPGTVLRKPCTLAGLEKAIAEVAGGRRQGMVFQA